MLGLSKEWVKVLEDGPDAFSRVATQARSAGVIVDETLIRSAEKFDKEWNRATTEWVRNLKGGMAEVMPTIEALVNKGFELVRKFNDFATASNIKAIYESGGKLSLDQLEAADRISKGQLNDDLKRQLETAREIARERQRGQALTGLSVNKPAKVTGSPTKIPTGDNSSDDEDRDALQRAIDMANKRIVVMNAETATIGLTCSPEFRPGISWVHRRGDGPCVEAVSARSRSFRC